MARPPQIDDHAPDFAITDIREKEIHLSDYAGEKYVLLVFDRSNRTGKSL